MELRPVYPVRTERLLLRPLVLTDTAALLAYRGDPAVCRYLPFAPMDETVLTARLAADLGRTAITAEGQSLTLGVQPAGGGPVVGDVVLFFHSAVQAAGEIGYVFHPAVAGRGYATEACAAVLDLAFDQLGLHRVVARMDARNDASRRVVQRLGLRHEAHHRRSQRSGETWVDVDAHALLAEEWQGR